MASTHKKSSPSPVPKDKGSESESSALVQDLAPADPDPKPKAAESDAADVVTSASSQPQSLPCRKCGGKYASATVNEDGSRTCACCATKWEPAA